MLWILLLITFFLYLLMFSPAILVIDILIIRRIIKRGGWGKYKIVFFLIPGVLLMSILIAGVGFFTNMLFVYLYDHFVSPFWLR
ncbi:hypothetical protein TI10_15260 [Photorhabdus luminescens subsp. luminescens]|uniref:Uncharacterized protein n=1 Tax=Photorhabdus luminescens TaxID=29488 RepID=A0A1G5RF67_PHOLU|nr:hypothetical protein TI10_15260 [Photorhabdus luminescens subsp. luminescens]SCZ72715.1 hypothetical protein SAMN02982990_04104 [Photorhabdus luminescens]